MRIVIFAGIMIVTVLGLDMLMLGGRLTQAAAHEANSLSQKARYEVWKIRYYYGI